MNVLKIFCLYITLCLCVMACVKDGPPGGAGTIVEPSDEVVYVCNEGNFQFGNASISAYNVVDSSVVEDIYKAVNGVPLGDVCQSMRFHHGKAYIVVNNSGKIEVVNAGDFGRIGTITGLRTPRYVLPVSNTKAYVTDLFGDSIAIVNLTTMQKTGAIACSGWTEEAHLIYGKAFVTNRYREKLYVINTATDVLVDSIAIGYGANSIVEDINGKLWVLCSGDITLNKVASLHRIDPLGHGVEQSFVFEQPNDTPWRLRINASFDTLYYLNNGVYSVPISSVVLPSSPFLAAGGRNFYGLGIHPRNSQIFVSDAIDYNQRGRIHHYQPDGQLIRSFLAGVIPGDFIFP